MGLHIAAWILIHWMLAIAWLDPNRLHFVLWAGLVVILWWFAWLRRNPPWPAVPEQRYIIYAIFAATIFMTAVLMNRWQGYLILVEVVLLLIAEMAIRRPRAA